MTEVYLCALCSRRLRTYVPRDGDGSLRQPVRHKNPAGFRCDGWMYEAVLQASDPWKSSPKTVGGEHGS